MPVAVITSAVVGAGAAVYSGNQNAKAIKNASNQQQQAADQSIAYQREARDYAQQVLSKYSVEGDAARGKMNTFLGLSPKPASMANGGGMPKSTGMGQVTQVDQQLPANGRGFIAQARLAEREANRATDTPMGSAPAAAADPTQTPAETQESAWKEYQQTPWGRIGQMEADKAGEQFLSNAGARGAALSGRVIRGTAELANEAQLRNFTGYYGALGGVADTGFNADTGIASGGQQFANSASNVLAANANNQSNLSIAKGQNSANTANDLASWVGWGIGQWPQATTTPAATGARSGASSGISRGLSGLGSRIG